MKKKPLIETDLFQLLSALKEGDSDAFESIYHIYSSRIYGNIFKMIKSEEYAKELHQEVFLKVWDKRHLIDPNQSFTSYLFQISKNTIYNFIRRRNLEIQVYNYLSVHNITSYSHVEEDLEFTESKKIIKEAIALLPERRRQIFELCKLEGKSYEEVSILLGISTSTINDHIVKAKKFIREKQVYLDENTFVIILLSSIFKNLN